MIAQIDGDTGGMGMASDVAESFLCDAEYLIFERRRKRSIGAANIEMDREAGGGRLLGEPGEAGGESVLGGDGTKIPDTSACFDEPFADVFPSAVDLLAGGGHLRLGEELRRKFELNGDADEA